MIWANNKNDKYKKTLLFLGLPLLLFLAMTYSGFILFNLYKVPPNHVFKPAKVIDVDAPLSAKLYFNDKLDTKVFSEAIIEGIDSANSTIELAMYSMDNTNIREAIERAAERGVRVNLLFSDRHQDFITVLLQDVNEGIAIKFIDSKSGYMHHKFLLIDRDTENRKLFFGSFNYTQLQERFDPSFVMESDCPKLLGVFAEEFDRIDSKDVDNLKKVKDYNPFAALINYSDGWLEVWFPPSSAKSNVKDRVISLIDKSARDIKIMIWYLTDKDIAASLLYKSRKTPVSIIADDYNWNSSDSALPIMAAQKERQRLDNLNIITDAKHGEAALRVSGNKSFNSFLHHHTLIADEEIVLFATNNWSKGGFFANDESLMISNIESIVKPFITSYEANYKINK